MKIRAPQYGSLEHEQQRSFFSIPGIRCACVCVFKKDLKQLNLVRIHVIDTWYTICLPECVSVKYFQCVQIHSLHFFTPHVKISNAFKKNSIMRIYKFWSHAVCRNMKFQLRLQSLWMRLDWWKVWKLSKFPNKLCKSDQSWKWTKTKQHAYVFGNRADIESNSEKPKWNSYKMNKWTHIFFQIWF